MNKEHATSTPNPDDYSVNEREGKYDIRFYVEGVVHMEIEAASMEEARAKAEEIMEEDNFGEEIHDVDEVRIDAIRKAPPMYRVIRDGRVMQSSRLIPGDLPRKPDAGGF